MKTTLLKVLAFTLVFVAILSLAACSDETTPDGTTETPGTVETPAAHTHTFSEAWACDETNHWHAATCSDNDECATAKDGLAAHDYDEYGECVCGAVDAHEHTYSETYTYDETNHWHAATCDKYVDCEDARDGAIAHTLDENEECYCGYSAEHTHKFGTTVAYDETGHWFVSTCDKDDTCTTAKGEFTAHTLDANDECECGYAATHTHKYASVLTYDATGHWYAATCDKDEACATAKSEFASHELDVNDECECGYATEHTHKFAETWEHDTDSHWHVAICSKDSGCNGLTDGLAPHEYGTDGFCECGAEKPHEHTFATVLTYDADGHWYAATCSKNEECATVQSGYATHTYDDNDTCSCGYVSPNHIHKYSETLTYDETGHWYAATCSKNEECATAQSGYATHTLNANDECDCGYAAEHTHKYATEWTYDADGHWHAVLCSKDETCVIADYAAHTFVEGDCACGAHTHIFASEWTYDDYNHWHAATCNATDECATLKADEAAHVWDENRLCSCGATKPYRGEGIYSEVADDFSDTTAEWATTNQKGTAVTNDGLYAENVMYNGGYALRFVNNSYANEAYVNLPLSGPQIGNTYSFETDLRINSDVGECVSERSNKAMFTFYFGGTTFVNWAWSGVNITVDNTDAENPVYKITGNELDYTINADEWINFRVDFDDVSLTERTIKCYVNGVLVSTETKTSASTNSISQLRVVMPATSTGTLYFDNFYFGTVGGNEGRGEGSKVSDSNTLDYTGTSASELNTAGKLVTTGSATIEGTGISANVESVNGNSALNLSHASSASGSEGYFNIKSDSLGKGFVFETDIMFTGATSTRSAGEFLQFFSSNLSTGATSFWGGMPSMSLKAVTTDGVTSYAAVVGDQSVTINPGEWFNIRYEFVDWSTTGNEIRVYINGELVCTKTNTKTTSAFYFIRVFMPKNSTSEVYLDNTFFNTVTFE